MREVLRIFSCVFFSCLGVFGNELSTPPPIPIADVEGEPSSYFMGTVNMITGNYCDSELDLVVPGPEPLVVSRNYSSSSGGSYSPFLGWELNHQFWVLGGYNDYKNHTRTFCVLMTEPSGARILYDAMFIHGHKGNLQVMMHPDRARGLTNCGSYEISGRTNLLNTKIDFTKGKKEAYAKLGSGECRHYLADRSRNYYEGEPRKYALADLHLPNGHEISYSYNATPRIRAISTYNAGRAALFNSIHFAYPSEDVYRRTPFFDISTSNGKKAHYTLGVDTIRIEQSFFYYHYLKSVTRSDNPPVNYQYWKDYYQTRHICRKEYPDGRYLAINYLGTKDQKCAHVASIQAPVGTTNDPVTVGQFSYTRVSANASDAYGNHNVYYFGDEQRLYFVKHYVKGADGQQILFNSDHFKWGKDKQASFLMVRSLADGNGKTIRSHEYTYDLCGNIIEDTFKGNLTGYGNDEIYSKQYFYSSDGLNLMTKEIQPTGKHTFYSYYSGTNLMASKKVSDGVKVLQREFYAYDANGMLSHRVIDNGSGNFVEDLSDVTERHITSISARQSAPGYGLPEVVEERYFDINTMQETLLRKTIRAYSQEGRIISEAVYDANNNYCYTCAYAYDGMGNLTYEKNPNGHEIYRQYDANGNKIYEQGPRPDCYRTFAYDFSNRLIREELHGNDGTCLAKTYSYDYLNNCIASTDFSGNTTFYQYDPFGHRTRVDYPVTHTTDGQAVVSSEVMTYDAAGNIASVTNGRGEVTTTTYNARNAPIHICYPDGTQEVLRYALSGLLEVKVNKDGSQVRYTYDALERPVSEEVYSSDGSLVKTVTHHYNGFRLLATIDGEGHATTYTYDWAGRKIREQCGNDVTSYEYDALGHQYKTVLGLGAEATVSIKEFDFMDRVIEERVQDASGEIQSLVQYAYDQEGNCIVMMEHHDDGVATTFKEYTVDNKLCKVVDALGNTTITTYNHNFWNNFGQNVLCVTVTDALGQRVITMMNARGKEVCREIYDPFGTLVSKRRSGYDAIDNRTEVVETVITPDHEGSRDVITRWSYGSEGRLDAIFEAAGSQDQKITRYVYNNYGQKAAIVKPDGVHVKYVYDGIGRLRDFFASDGSFSYCYCYDRNDNPVRVDDILHGTSTLRSYDGSRRVMSETLATGLETTYVYDSRGHRRQVVLPDGSSVRYNYCGDWLRDIERYGEDGTVRYCHRYIDYNIGGKVRKVQGIEQAGMLSYDYDLLGRVIAIESVYYRESIEDGDYDAVGNLLATKIEDPQGMVQCDYSYDALYQLKSEEGIASHTYCHDSLSNRVNKDGEDHVINDLNQLLCDGAKSYEYDPNGNLVRRALGAKEDFQYCYDALDRLIAVQDSSGLRVEYCYDAFNRRLSKSFYRKECCEGVERYLYDGQDEIGSLDADGVFVELRVLGLGRGAEIGAAIALEIKGRLLAPVHNSRGDVVMLIEADSGVMVTSYRYSAFGEEEVFTTGSWWRKDSIAHENPWRFQSKRVDTETGFVLFGRRFYDPGIGRWISPDPLGFEAGPNLYAYVNNSPLTHWDLYGLYRLADDKAKAFPSSLHRLAKESANAWIIGAYPQIASNCTKYLLQTFNQRPHSRNGVVGFGEVSNDVRISFINGVNCDLKHAVRHAKHISSSHGNVNVHYTHDASHTLIGDVADCIAGAGGRAYRSARLLSDNWKGLLQEMNSDGKIIHYAHSQGALTTRLALGLMENGEERRIQVYTFGAAQMVRNKECAGAANYVSRRDGVPLIGSIVSGFLSAGERFGGILDPDVNIQYTGKKGLPFTEHSFDKGTYRKVWENLGKTFKKDQGEVSL